MFTINAYSFHPLVSRFLTLWRYVEVVTDWVTFFLSCLCCQCLNNMPGVPPPEEPGSSKTSVETPQIIPRVAAVDPGLVCGEPLRPQHLVIDFHQQAGDNEGVAQKCNDFWTFVRSQPDLDGLQAMPDGNNKVNVKEQHAVQRIQKNEGRLHEYPAVHMLTKMHQLGQPIDASAAPEQTPKLI